MNDNKICFLIHSLNAGGAERTVSYLVNYISKQKYDIDLVIYGDVGCYDLEANVNLIRLISTPKNCSIIKKLCVAIKRFFSFKKYLRENKPKVIFCMLYPSILYCLFSRKIIISSERSNPAYLKGFKKIVRNTLFMLSDGVVFQTERAKNFYSKRIQKKGIVISNAVGNPEAYKIEFSGKRRKAIVAIGSLKREKDYYTLIHACKKVFEKYSDYVLEIYGDGYLKNDLNNLSVNLGLSEKIKFMGVQKNVLSLVKDASCYVLSSESEGMPNALMEALAIGLPCVSTNCPNGPSELISDEFNGILVPVGDAEKLSNAIIRIIEDEQLANKLSTNAKKILETNNIEVISQKYLNFIESFIQK